MKNIIFLLLITFLASCSGENKNNNKILIFLNESYDNNEIFLKIDQANKLIRKKQLDSLANTSTGLEILDKLNKIKANEFSSQSSSFEDYPIYKAFTPNTSLNKDGEAFIDSSALIGFSDDTITFLQLINQATELFPEDIYWKFHGEMIIGYKNVYALKDKSQRICLSKNNIDSILIRSEGLNEIGGVLGKIAEAKGMTAYFTSIKLKNEVFDKLKNGTYGLFLLINSNGYSGSIIKTQTQRNKFIDIGKLKDKDFEILKQEFSTITNK
jgi:hypothetical protein